MEKSIETIWKEGFLKNDTLVAPKLNNLYNQKSKHIIEKFKRIGKINLYAIPIGASLILLASFFLSIPIIGLFLFSLLITMALVARKMGLELKKINNSTSSYEYLKSFDNWLQKSISIYKNLYRFINPLLVFGIMLGTWFIVSDMIIDKIMDKFPGLSMIFGVPMIVLLFITALAGLIAIFSNAIFKWDINIVYGRILKKINEILADMEELRS